MAAEYSFQDVKVHMKGRLLTACRGIKYKTTKTHNNIAVLGSDDPGGYSRSVKNREGTLKLLQSEFDALTRGLKPGEDPTDLAPFDITVVYQIDGRPEIITDRLIDCRIGDWEKGFEAEDEFMEIELPLTIGRIELNK